MGATGRGGEEVGLLTSFVLLRTRHEDLLASVGVLARVEHHRRERHGGGGKVLHLLQIEVQTAQHLFREGFHVALAASRVRRDEVRDELVAQGVVVADAAEIGVQPLEHGERRFAHERQNMIFGMLGRDLQAARGVVLHDGLQIGGTVEQIIAYAAAYEGFLHPFHAADALVKREQARVVVVQIGTLRGVEARRAPAFAADIAVAAAHAVHVGRGRAHVGDVALEIGHARYALHLGEDRPLAARIDELALMRRYGAERAAAEAAAMDIDRVFYHLPCGDVAFAAVAGVRSALVRQVERAVELLGGKSGVRRRDHHVAVARALDERRRGLHHVAQGLLRDEVAAEYAFVGEALLVGCEMQRMFGIEPIDIIAVGEESDLADLAQQFGVESVAQGARHLLHHPLAHAVHQQVGAAVDENRRFEAVAPVVVMRQPPQRSLDAAYDHRHVGIEPFENSSVYRDGVIGSESRLAARRVGVVAAQADVGGVVVHHRVHRSRRDAEKEPRRAQLGEVAQVVAPVGLRHDGHATPLGLQQAADHRRAERRVVDIGVAREQDHVDVIPPQGPHLFYRRR